MLSLRRGGERRRRMKSGGRCTEDREKTAKGVQLPWTLSFSYSVNYWKKLPVGDYT